MLPNPYGPPTPTLTPPLVTKPLQIRKKDPRVVGKVEGELLAIQQELQELDLVNTKDREDAKGKGKEKETEMNEKEEEGEIQGPGMTESRTTNILSTPPSKRKSVPPNSSSPLPELPFRIIKPSLPTLEKATSVALFFEAFYTTLLRPPTQSQSNYLLNRAKRSAQLEESFNLLENRFMSEGERQYRREELVREEGRILRDRRGRVDAKAFEMGRVIGHGAFGVVRIAREKQGGRLVAMKQVSTPFGGQYLGPQITLYEIR
jgi:hypothetical protein